MVLVILDGFEILSLIYRSGPLLVFLGGLVCELFAEAEGHLLELVLIVTLDNGIGVGKW
jgi:hypothetical protein